MAYSSTRPYLIQAMLAWMEENQLTPYILVNADYASLMIPREHVEDHRIVLDISPNAVRDFLLTDKLMTFHAGFSGKREDLYIPLGAIEAIFSHETGAGIPLGDLDENPPPLPEKNGPHIPFQMGANVPVSPASKKKPHLSIVRSESSSDSNKDS